MKFDLYFSLGPELVAAAINQGYRLIDTAEFYHNEEGVGSGWKQSGKKREDVFIVSKWWPSAEGAKGAIKTLDRCLKGFFLIKICFFSVYVFLLVCNRIMSIYIFFMHHKVVIVRRLIVHYSMRRNKERLGRLISKKIYLSL
jgi:hypothetical protein